MGFSEYHTFNFVNWPYTKELYQITEDTLIEDLQLKRHRKWISSENNDIFKMLTSHTTSNGRLRGETSSNNGTGQNS